MIKLSWGETLILDPEFVKKIDEYAANGDFKGMDNYVNSHPDLAGKETTDYGFLHLNYYIGKLLECGQFQYEGDYYEGIWSLKRYDLLFDYVITISKYHCSKYAIVALIKYFYDLNDKQMDQFKTIIADKISKGDNEYYYLGMVLYGMLFLSLYKDTKNEYPDGRFGFTMDQALQLMIKHYQFVNENNIVPKCLKEDQKVKSLFGDDLIQKLAKIIATMGEKENCTNVELLRLTEDKESYRNTYSGIGKNPAITRKVEQLVNTANLADEKIFKLINKCSLTRMDEAEKMFKDEKVEGLTIKDLFEIGKFYFELGHVFHFQAKYIFYFATMKGDVDSSYYFAYMLDKGLGKRLFFDYEDEYWKKYSPYYYDIVKEATKCGWYYKSAKMGNKKAIEHLDRLIMAGDLEAMLYSGKY